MPMRLTVMLFGPQAIQAGARELAVEFEGDRVTVGEVRRILAVAQPALAGTLPSSRVSRNCEFVEDGDFVCATDEVALLGMMNGG